MKKTEANTKRTFKVYTPLMRLVGQPLRDLPIQRDDLLNGLLRVEVDRLKEVLRDKRLSEDAHRYIQGEFWRLCDTPIGKPKNRPGAETVSVVLDKTVAAALDGIVRDANLVRDALFNRMLYLLRASEGFLKFHQVPPSFPTRITERYLQEDLVPTSPLKALESLLRDPFQHLRDAFNSIYEDFEEEGGLYLLTLPPGFKGFSVYLEDEQVPGTAPYERSQQALADALALFDELENGSFNPEAPKGG
jgi:hypothetical protein